MKQKILFIDSVHPFLAEELEKYDFQCDLNYSLSREEIQNCIDNYVGVVIRSKIKLDKYILEDTKKLKFIARAGAGMENIDVTFAEGKGIKCIHAPEGNRDAVGEHALGMLLALFNNLCRANQQVRDGKWIREGNRGIELKGKTVGIIGYGNMGSSFAKRLEGFDVKVLAFDKYKKGFSNKNVKESSLEKLYEEADIISLHVPLTPETHYMVNDSFMSKFKKNFYLINTSRGKVVKTDDLAINLQLGKVLGACLDVLEYENISFEQVEKTSLPETFKYLIQSDKVMLSPHIAGWTHESNEKIAKILAEKIKKIFPR